MKEGRRKMEDGRRKMGEGRWKMEDGRWKMEDGRWKMEDGRWEKEGKILHCLSRNTIKGVLMKIDCFSQFCIVSRAC